MKRKTYNLIIHDSTGSKAAGSPITMPLRSAHIQASNIQVSTLQAINNRRSFRRWDEYVQVTVGFSRPSCCLVRQVTQRTRGQSEWFAGSTFQP